MAEETQNNPQPASTGGGMDGKTIGIISYLTLIGTIIAFVMNNDKKDQLAAFHIRQMLGIALSGFAVSILGTVLAFVPKIGWMISMLTWVLYLGLMILWVIGILGAVNGQKKSVPVLGPLFQQWFGGLQKG